MNEPQYITEMKELCAKNAQFKIGNTLHELLSVEKMCDKYYLNYIKTKNNQKTTVLEFLTLESSLKYLRLTKLESTTLFLKGLLFLQGQILHDQKGSIKQSQAELLLSRFADEINKACKKPMKESEIKNIIAEIERELEKC